VDPRDAILALQTASSGTSYRWEGFHGGRTLRVAK